MCIDNCVSISLCLCTCIATCAVGRAFAWEARSRGFESHLRLSSLRESGMSQVCVVCHLHCLTTFLISSNIHVTCIILQYTGLFFFM